MKGKTNIITRLHLSNEFQILKTKKKLLFMMELFLYILTSNILKKHLALYTRFANNKTTFS